MPAATLDFEQDVIEASREAPVLVDFWAPWCQPCQVLGPRLEALAEEAASDEDAAWSLVKVNTDEEPGLAQRFGVRGLPTVKLFHEGEVIDEFTGAKPERALRQWLDAALPSEEKARLESAREALAEGRFDTAASLLREARDDDPENDEAQILLARALVFDEPREAAALADEAAPADSGLRQTQESVQTVSRLLMIFEEDGPALPEGPPQDYLRAIDALSRSDFDAALERFIAVVREDRDYDDDGARKACVALFTLLGPEHPATQKHRPVFDRALY
jgi:putative thioredoxin